MWMHLCWDLYQHKDFPVTQMVKNLPAMQKTRIWSLSWEDPLEKRMTSHSSILVWRIPWTEELGRMQSMGSQRVGHNWVTSLSLSCIVFTVLRQVPSRPIFWRVLIINGGWILSKAFVASIEIVIWFLSFNLLIWCITLFDFAYINESLHSWN